MLFCDDERKFHKYCNSETERKIYYSSTLHKIFMTKYVV